MKNIKLQNFTEPTDHPDNVERHQKQDAIARQMESIISQITANLSGTEKQEDYLASLIAKECNDLVFYYSERSGSEYRIEAINDWIEILSAMAQDSQTMSISNAITIMKAGLQDVADYETEKASITKFGRWGK